MHARVLGEELSTCSVEWVLRLSTMQCKCRCWGVSATRSPRNSTKFSERVESVIQPATSPECTSSPANSTRVPWRW
jgi:hypothetical protein